VSDRYAQTSVTAFPKPKTVQSDERLRFALELIADGGVPENVLRTIAARALKL